MRAPIVLLGLALLLGTASAAQATVILPPGSTWEYTFSDPTADSTWNTTVGGWTTGAAPFGNTSGGDFGANTSWPASGAGGDDLWVRTAVNLSAFDLSTIEWFLGVDNGFKLYVNGNLVSSANAEGFTTRWEYSGLLSSGILTAGQNVIAVALEDHGGLTAFDMELTGRELPGTPVPEPATLTLMGLGLAGIARRRLLARG